MKVLFLQRDPFVKLGIISLAGVLKTAGHQCDVLVEGLERDIVRQAVASRPDIVAFSITTTEYSWMRSIGQKIREKFKGIILCGGPHPTFYPEVIQEDYLNAICIGEGEGAILDFANALQEKLEFAKIDNLNIKKDGAVIKNRLRPLIEDLDALPLSGRTVYDRYPFFKNQNISHVISGRGCPFVCTFCFNKIYNQMYAGKGAVIRKRKVACVISELKELKERNKQIRHILFVDDVFVLSRPWIDEFAEEYRRQVNLPFSCTARANLVNDELIRKLKKAGCFSIRLGLESANDFLRNEVFKKAVSKTELENSAAIIKRYGIRLLFYNILGAPGETLDTALETFLFNRRLRPTYAWCSLMQPYPGTEICAYAIKNGFLEKEYDFSRMENSCFMDTPIKMENKRQILHLQKLFSAGVFFRFPAWLMKILVKLPFSGAFELIFKAGYALGISRMDNISLARLMTTAMISKNFFKKMQKNYT